MPYQTDFITTYKLIEGDESDQLYRLQFLQAFNLVDWDSQIIEEITQQVYGMVKEDERFKEYISLSPNRFNDDLYLSFQFLFSYDTFDLLHLCLIDFLTNDTIKDCNYQNLIDKLLIK